MAMSTAMPSRRRPRATASASCTSSSTTRMRIVSLPLSARQVDNAASSICGHWVDCFRVQPVRVGPLHLSRPLYDPPSDVLRGETYLDPDLRDLAVIDEGHRNAGLSARCVDARGAQRLSHPRADPACDHTILDRHDQ